LFYRYIEPLAEKKYKIQTLFDTRSGRIIIFVLFCMLPNIKAQQDPQYSQNMFNHLTINPAYAGNSEMINLQALSRTQWMGLPGNPKTTVFGGDAAISAFGIEGGLGLSVIVDQLGYLKNNRIDLSGSTKFRLENGTLSGGISLSFQNQKLDPDSWIAGPQGESSTSAAVAAEKLNGSVFDVGVGAFYKTSLFYGGFSIQHLFNPVPKYDNDGFYYLKRSYYITGGYYYKLLDRPIELQPSVFIKTDAVSYQADINCNVLYKKRYWGGLSYRLQDAVVVLAGVETKSGLRIGVSYDVPASRFSRNFGGSVEVSLGYSFKMSIEKKVKKYKSVRYL
jgi:type IX secretion system PorP/SprF family membrane protein